VKRRLQPGDKMAVATVTRVLFQIVPIEDMPYTATTAPRWISCSPAGRAFAYEVGQILEVHLGWAAKVWGSRLAICSRRRPRSGYAQVSR